MPESLSLTLRLLTLLVGLTLWLAQYFIINNISRPASRRVNFSTVMDEVIPYFPGFIFVYLSTYLFGILPFVLIQSTSLFISTTLAYVIVASVSSTFHVLYPSQVQRREAIEKKSLSCVLITWFQRICKPYGNFPSTHMGFSVLSVCIGFVVGGPMLGGIFLIWACLIGVSALSIKQHYVLDIITGGFIGAGAALLIVLIT